jgi:mannose-1-phosphate guanylyltransferase
VMAGATVGNHCTLRNCVIASDARIGDHCQIDGQAVVGAGAVVGANNQLTNHARLFPGVPLPDGALLF